MNIVIKIPEDTYKDIIKNGFIYDEDNEVVTHAIKNGISLPKGHGRLIDADELKKEYPHDTDWDYPVNSNSYVVESIDISPTIIEAESEE